MRRTKAHPNREARKHNARVHALAARYDVPVALLGLWPANALKKARNPQMDTLRPIYQENGWMNLIAWYKFHKFFLGREARISVDNGLQEENKRKS